MLIVPEIVCRRGTDTGDILILRVVARAELKDTLFTSLFQKIVRICVSEFGLRIWVRVRLQFEFGLSISDLRDQSAAQEFFYNLMACHKFTYIITTLDLL